MFGSNPTTFHRHGLEPYETNNVDEVSSSLVYAGKEDKDGKWVIQKVQTSGTVVSVSYATLLNNPGYGTYSAAWSNRTALTYGSYAEAF